MGFCYPARRVKLDDDVPEANVMLLLFLHTTVVISLDGAKDKFTAFVLKYKLGLILPESQHQSQSQRQEV